VRHELEFDDRTAAGYNPGVTLEARAGQALGWWADWVRRRARLVVALALPTFVWLGYYAFTSLGVNTDTGGMISDELPWRQAELAFQRGFPQLEDEIQVVVEGQTPDQVDAVRRALVTELAADTALFESVYVFGGGDYFERNALLFLDQEELVELRDNIGRFAPWIRRLEQRPHLDGALAVVDSAMHEAREGADLEVAPLIGVIAGTFYAQTQRQLFQVSWQEVIRGRRATPADRRLFFSARPHLDFSSGFPARPAMERIREAFDELPVGARRGARVRLTGRLVIDQEAFASAAGSSTRAGLLALLFVTATLYLGLRSKRLLIASLITLVGGLCGTAAFAAFAVGSLNMISIAFGVLYIGLGIDYAIHFCLGYREGLRQGHEHAIALRNVAEGVGSSILLSAITTAFCFYAFVPTDFVGLAELGLISGTGMFISLATTLTLLPALLSLFPLDPAKLAEKDAVRWSHPLLAEGRFARYAWSFLYRHRFVVLGGAAVAAGVSLALIPRARFDHDHTNLSDPGSESIAVYRELLADTTASTLTIAILEPDEESARRTADRLERLPEVRAALTLHDFVPRDQAGKREILAQIGDLLGPAPEALAIEPRSPAPEPTRVDRPDRARPGERRSDDSLTDARFAAIERFQASLEEHLWHGADESSELAHQAHYVVRNWRRELDTWPPSTREQAVDVIEANLVGTLTERLRLFRRALEPDENLDMSRLPRDLSQRWLGVDGEWRVEVLPSEPPILKAHQEAFVDAVHAVAPHATGVAVTDLEAGRVAVSAFRSALLWATIATAAILLALLHSPLAMGLMLVPLLLAGLLTGGASVLLDLPFNFANVITLPLLLGVGVDNGIHMVHRARVAPPSDGNMVATSTARAVLFATLTTMLSFGNLGFATHRGMATMGQMLTLGMSAVLICTLVVLPTLLALLRNSKEPLASQ
jgi:hopanoid biosynthesis associated RND transporter like protein HpnN